MSKLNLFFSKSLAFLKFFSVGRYPTVLYYNRRNFQSSLTGGLITLAMWIVMLWYTISTLSGVFMRDNYNLQVTSRGLHAFQVDGNGTVTNKLSPCEGDCLYLTVKDVIPFLSNVNFVTAKNPPDG